MSQTSADKDKPVKVAVDVRFYDLIMGDLTQHRNAIVALNSLNHWTGASYVEIVETKPRCTYSRSQKISVLTVRGTWDPPDGSSMSIENNEVKVKTEGRSRLCCYCNCFHFSEQPSQNCDSNMVMLKMTQVNGFLVRHLRRKK